MAVPKPFIVTILSVLCYLSIAAQLTVSSGEFLYNIVEHDDDDKKCPEKCVIGAGAWKKVAVSCKRKGGGARKCGHNGHHDKCMVMRCKKWNKLGYKCSCKHEEDEDRCPYKCFTTGKKYKLAKASCMKGGKKLTCDHDDHDHGCEVEKCTVGGKKGYWCACADH